jgi:hypothetical protein
VTWLVTMLDGQVDRVSADVIEVRDGCLWIKTRPYNGGVTAVAAVYPLTSVRKWERDQ